MREPIPTISHWVHSFHGSMKHFAQTCLLVGLLMAAIPATAQSAAIRGLVTDPSGASVREVQITLTNENTGVVWHAKSNGSGLYSLSGVLPGRYTLVAEAPGFARFAENAITVETAQNLTLDAKLRVGSAKESVTVNGSGIQVNTTDAAVSTVVDQQFVENIPLNGRSLQSLISSVPGVAYVPAGVGSTLGGGLTVNGQRTEGNYYTLDGVSISAGGTLNRAMRLGR
jgi:outer membrane receptor for monomeric catechols